jgi:D-sedoheptulose 7-phosphate isomerase
MLARYPSLREIEASVNAALDAMIESFHGGNKLLICGNGGSAADALHIVGELMKDFVIPRKLSSDVADAIKASAGSDSEYILANLQGSLPAIAIVSEIALDTAYANDRALTFRLRSKYWAWGDLEIFCLE